MGKFLKGFKYGFKGLIYAFRTQINFKVHTVAAMLAILSGYVLKITNLEWLWIFLAISLVLVSELFNTALEVLVDLVSPGFNQKAGVVKDVAAGAVLVIALFAVATGLIIFLPKIF